MSCWHLLPDKSQKLWLIIPVQVMKEADKFLFIIKIPTFIKMLF